MEQLPFYLRDVYGREAVVEASQRTGAGRFPPDSREAHGGFQTISWWLSGKGMRQAAEHVSWPPSQ